MMKVVAHLMLHPATVALRDLHRDGSHLEVDVTGPIEAKELAGVAPMSIRMIVFVVANQDTGQMHGA